MPAVDRQLDDPHEPAVPAHGRAARLRRGAFGAVARPSLGAHVYVEYDADAPDLARVQAAIRELFRRHEMLRTLARDDGRQHPAKEADDWELEVHDLRDLGEVDRTTRLASLRTSIGHTPRELDRWPSSNVVACRTSGAAVRFLIRFDLLTGDLRSIQILVREFEQLYRGIPVVRQGRPFREFVELKRADRDGEEFAAATRYWLDRLDDFPDAPSLPLRPRALELRECEFTRRSSSLSVDETARFEARARALGVTTSAALLTAYAAVLATWSSEQRFTVTLPILDRGEDGWDDTSATSARCFRSSWIRERPGLGGRRGPSSSSPAGPAARPVQRDRSVPAAGEPQRQRDAPAVRRGLHQHAQCRLSGF